MLDNVAVTDLPELQEAISEITVPEDHMVYLVQKIRDGRHISRYKNLADAAKAVTGEDDYAVLVPRNEVHDPSKMLDYINGAGSDKIVHLGSILLQEAER